jgi:hypothetical protein
MWHATGGGGGGGARGIKGLRFPSFANFNRYIQLFGAAVSTFLHNGVRGNKETSGAGRHVQTAFLK